MTAASPLPKEAMDRLQALYAADELAEADGLASALLEHYPAAFDLHNFIGTVRWRAGDLPGAEAAYATALQLAPDNLSIRFNHAFALRKLGRTDEALAAYETIHAARPAHVPTLINIGVILQERRRYAEAAERFARATELAPDNVDAIANLANVRKDQGEEAQAIALFERALALAPGHASSLYGLAICHEELGDFAAALAALDRALEARPDHPEAGVARRHLEATTCTWRHRAPEEDVALAERGGSALPFAMLWWRDDPAWHRRLAERYVAQAFPHLSAPLPARPRAAGAPLRLGYFSADFHEHATMHLAAGLFRDYDPARFELFAYSYGTRLDDEVRALFARHGVTLRDVRALDDAAVAAQARADGLDIAVDLKGYTHLGRVGPFAARAAPVQVSYLGYPGTLGAPFMDYIVADPVVIPPELAAHYTERVIRLPHSYQINDRLRPVPPPPPSRAACGLPETGFVFCCFNNTYKITPAEFDIWMRLLRAVAGSVLWLFAANVWAVANLRREAAARGVDPERLVFAPFAAQRDHLARHAHAGLVLDCFVCNAHTTASDALWCGVPVVTMPGRAFGARVAASLVRAVGLPECATASPAEYEALALDLARDPARLADLKQRLAAARSTAPLFDTVRTVRALEAGFRAAHERAVAGLPPADIDVG